VTKPLDQTSRDLLLDIHARMPKIEGSLKSLLDRNRELEQGRDKDRTTIRLLDGIVTRLLREKDEAMRVIGCMTVERMRVKS
jgi:hypothetical protein